MLSVIGQLVNQKIAPGLDAGFRSSLIKLFYEIDHTYKKDLAAVQQNGVAVKYVKAPDYRHLFVRLVEQDGVFELKDESGKIVK